MPEPAMSVRGAGEASGPWVLLRWSAYALFYGYVLLLVVAGFWGLVLAPVDLALVVGFEVSDDDPQARIDLISQYRFLRAMEFGVGVFILWYRKEVFTSPIVNSLFLTVLGAGILARTISLFVEGNPSPAFWFFLLSETAGFVAIYSYTRRVNFYRL